MRSLTILVMSIAPCIYLTKTAIQIDNPLIAFCGMICLVFGIIAFSLTMELFNINKDLGELYRRYNDLKEELEREQTKK